MAEHAPADAASAAAGLLADTALLPPAVTVGFSDGCGIRIRSDSAPLLENLAAYFAGFPADGARESIEVLALERSPWPASGAFRDWPREAGKRGRKDSFHDLADGRLLHKVRTGMRFLQSDCYRIASGPCLAHPNQVVNFVNSQYLNRQQQRGWLLCHAAAVQGAAGVIAVAGLSGGGKSTVMLQLMESPDLRFVTNDRLLIRRGDAGVAAQGIAKWPRVNPGTVLGNPALHALVAPRQLQTWRALPADRLWHLEDKHDVPVPALYGAGRVSLQGPLAALVILNWSREVQAPVQLQRCPAADRAALLRALAKDAGPFYCDARGRFARGPVEPDPAGYLEVVGDVPVYEVTGGVDFPGLKGAILAQLPGRTD